MTAAEITTAMIATTEMTVTVAEAMAMAATGIMTVVEEEGDNHTLMVVKSMKHPFHAFFVLLAALIEFRCLINSV